MRVLSSSFFFNFYFLITGENLLIMAPKLKGCGTNSYVFEIRRRFRGKKSLNRDNA